MDPVMGRISSHSYPAIYQNLPFDSALNVQLQIILLYSQENERGGAGKCLGSHVDKTRATFARLVHSLQDRILAP
jgi:hypothetical protein